MIGTGLAGVTVSRALALRGLELFVIELPELTASMAIGEYVASPVSMSRTSDFAESFYSAIRKSITTSPGSRWT